MSGRFGCRIGRRPESQRGTVWREVTREWYGVTGSWVRIIKCPKGQALRFLYSLNEHNSSTGSLTGLLPGSQHSFSYRALTRLSALFLLPGSYQALSTFSPTRLSSLCLCIPGSFCLFTPGSQHWISYRSMYTRLTLSLYTRLSALFLLPGSDCQHPMPCLYPSCFLSVSNLP